MYAVNNEALGIVEINTLIMMKLCSNLLIFLPYNSAYVSVKSVYEKDVKEIERAEKPEEG